MKIAVDVTPILRGGECGGAKQVLLELLRGFGERALSDEFILLTSFQNHAFFQKFENSRVKCLCISKNSISIKFSLLRRILNRIRREITSSVLPGILKKNDVSILFCPMTAPTYFEAGIPTVAIVHDLQHLYYPSFFSKQELIHRNHFYEELKRKVDYVICVSSFTKKGVIEKLDISPDKVFVIPNCVHSRLDVPSQDMIKSVLRKFGLEEKKYCFYPANLWPHKNHKMLFVAFNMFTKRYPNYNLHLVLTGEKIENSKILDDAVKQMGLGEKIHFLGYLSEEELAVIWYGSHFLIFPSLFEGFGIPLVEAMMYGKPIVTSNVTSIPEVVGDAAVYFDPKKPDEIANAICEIMGNEKLHNLLVAKGRERLALYNFNSMVGSYLEILHQAGKEGSKITKTEISGIYSDGWAGDFIHITVRESGDEKTFHLKGYIPDWHKNDKMKIKINTSYGEHKEYMLRKNEVLNIQEPINKKYGKLDIKISGGFVPGGEDIRTLTFMVEEAEIFDKGTGKKLYEFKRKG